MFARMATMIMDVCSDSEGIQKWFWYFHNRHMVFEYSRVPYIVKQRHDKTSVIILFLHILKTNGAH